MLYIVNKHITKIITCMYYTIFALYQK
jgi:hypothetical protein